VSPVIDPNEPFEPVPVAPVAIAPDATQAVALDAGPTDAVATDPIATDPIAADPIATDPAVDEAALEVERLARAAEREAELARVRAEALELATARAALAGRRVLVAGLGESGLAIARWAAFRGADVTVADSREAPPQLAALRAACPGVRFVGGALETSLLEGIDLVGWSQGLSPITGDAAPLFAAAREAGLPVWGELEFFAREIARLRAAGHDGRVVAITGTNGKTTTTRLVGHLCRQAGLRVAVCGNISPAALEALREAIEHDDLPQVWVLELASYQLWLAESFVPDCGTVLNVTQDHLDWHGTMADYLGAKQRVYAPGTVCVFNRDDPLSVPGATLPAEPGAELAAAPVDEAAGLSKAERLAARRAVARAERAAADARAATGCTEHGTRLRHRARRRSRLARRGGRRRGCGPVGPSPPRRRRDPREPADAGRCAAHPRRPQPCQCAGRARARARRRRADGRDAARPACLRRRAPPLPARLGDPRHRVVRRQQGHQRRRDRGRAGRPGQALRADRRRRRQGPGLQPARARGRRARGGGDADRPRCTGDPRGARRHRRAAARLPDAHGHRAQVFVEAVQRISEEDRQPC